MKIEARLQGDHHRRLNPSQRVPTTELLNEESTVYATGNTDQRDR
jgi:hypothetical protein